MSRCFFSTKIFVCLLNKNIDLQILKIYSNIYPLEVELLEEISNTSLGSFLLVLLLVEVTTINSKIKELRLLEHLTDSSQSFSLLSRLSLLLRKIFKVELNRVSN